MVEENGGSIENLPHALAERVQATFQSHVFIKLILPPYTRAPSLSRSAQKSFGGSTRVCWWLSLRAGSSRRAEEKTPPTGPLSRAPPQQSPSEMNGWVQALSDLVQNHSHQSRFEISDQA